MTHQVQKQVRFVMTRGLCVGLGWLGLVMTSSFFIPGFRGVYFLLFWAVSMANLGALALVGGYLLKRRFSALVHGGFLKIICLATAFLVISRWSKESVMASILGLATWVVVPLGVSILFARYWEKETRR